MSTFISTHWLDILTTIIGLVYIILEYKASIWLWVAGIVMPALDIFLYWTHGLYADAGMAVYYLIAAIYGLLVWKFGHKHNQKANEEMPITHMPARLYLPSLLFFAVAWLVVNYILINFTDSNIPILDSFSNALSFVGLWTLARKYIEQWLFWIVVDVISSGLYVYKEIPFKAGLYALYVIIAVMGYYQWKRMMSKDTSRNLSEGVEK